MTVIFEGYTVPKRGMFEINVKRSVNIQVTAEEARHKVGQVSAFISMLQNLSTTRSRFLAVTST
jgi:hypothetical protein